MVAAGAVTAAGHAVGGAIVVRPPSAVAAVTTPSEPTAITASTSRMRRIVEYSPL